ncbi:hypothetical protein FPOAC1_006439 [Fusarium poae]|uniref:hypothetical protein n=1 Tax=Fusarium poae TaxID=36050 RepID=UPI001CEA5BCE|nr:hypothetical protein FPOAC1_006439 [Fusarium poae]KAG8673135.1 hypothetical protein FPOAC1_006439 [Fusarium poae]
MPPTTRSKGVRVKACLPEHPFANDEYYRLLAFVKQSINDIINNPNNDIENRIYNGIPHGIVEELLFFQLHFEHNIFPNINSALYPTYKQVKAKLCTEWNRRYAQTYGGRVGLLYRYGLEALVLNADEMAKIESFYKDITSQRTNDGVTPSSTEETIEAPGIAQPTAITAPPTLTQETTEAGVPQPTAIIASPTTVIPQRPSIAQAPTKSETKSKARLKLKNKKARPKATAPKLKSENSNLKIARRKNRNLDVGNQNNHVKSAMNRPRRNSSNPVDHEEITRLRNQVELGHRFSLLERGFNPEGSSMSADEISQSFQALFQRIRDTCWDVARDSNIEFQSDVEDSEVINSWSRKTFKSELGVWLQTQIGGSMTTENLLMGVVGAAIIELAFQPAFPKILRRKPRIVNKYREIILCWGGSTSLRNADFLMFSQLIEDEKGEIIDKGTKEIADRIVKGLQQQQRLQQPGGTQKDDQLMYKPVEASDFMSVLEKALTLKLDLTASMSRLKFIYFTPEEHFDDLYMTRCRGSDHGTFKIKACIFPALFLEPRRDEADDSGDYVLQHSADYNTYFTELVGEILSPSALVAKAMVLT